jgi:hypothetical protein
MMTQPDRLSTPTRWLMPSDSEGISSWLRNHLVASPRHSSVSAYRLI